MTRADKLVLVALGAIFLFLLYAVRVRERLSCVAVIPNAGLECERVQAKLIASRDERFRIPDPSSVELRLSSLTTASHTSTSTSVIQARDAAGRRVILLSVPERETSDAAELVTRLRNVDAAATGPTTFERDESKQLWILVLVTAGTVAAYTAMLKFRNSRRADPLAAQ
jgi:hypothetical protein